MSTRGHVAIKENGKYKYIYNHNDSYISELGKTLFNYYNNMNKVKELIDLGDTSHIGTTINNYAKTYRRYCEVHIPNKKYRSETVAYFRDGNRWEDYNGQKLTYEQCVARETEDINEVLQQEFVYIYDVEENKWYVARENEKYILKELETVVNSLENK